MKEKWKATGVSQLGCRELFYIFISHLIYNTKSGGCLCGYEMGNVLFGKQSKM